MAERSKRSKRLALNDEGNDVADFTEAVRFVYQYVEPDEDDKDVVVAEVAFVPATDDVMTRALAGFGFHTHAGNWVNRLVNTKKLTGSDVADGLDEYKQMLVDGGWTNRKGEAEAGAAIFQEAFARWRGVEVERVKEAWASWDDDTKDAVKKDEQIKLLVQEIRLERQRKRAEEAAAKGESKLSQLAL